VGDFAGFLPRYKRSQHSDALYDTSGFFTDKQLTKTGIWKYGRRLTVIWKYGKRLTVIWKYGKRLTVIWKYGRKSTIIWKYGRRSTVK
jgi:hypothetical protein